MSTVDDLVARSNRLGADARNTNYAGGNTSAKGSETDPVTGQPVDLLWVKGSGGDLGTLTADGLAVLRLVGRLEVGALEDRVVAIDPDPGEGRDDALGPLGTVAGGVGVLDAQDEPAAGPLGQCPVEQRRTSTADMEHAGGRGSETNPNHARPPGC